MIKEKRSVKKYSMSGEFLQEYESINQASKENNISAVNIINCLKKRQNSAAGFTWKYKDVHIHKLEPKSPNIVVKGSHFINDDEWLS